MKRIFSREHLYLSNPICNESVRQWYNFVVMEIEKCRYRLQMIFHVDPFDHELLRCFIQMGLIVKCIRYILIIYSSGLIENTVVKAWDPESPEWKRFRPVFERENGIIYYKRESGEEMWLWVDGRFYSEGFISLLAAKLLRIMKTS